MDSRYLESTFNRSWRVCGRRLRPYSAAHLLSLETHGSPLCAGAPTASLSPLALYLAVALCAGRVQLTGGAYLPRQAVRPRLGLRGFFWLVGMELFPGLFRREAEKFLAYVRDFAALPGRAREIVGPGGTFTAGGGITGPYVLARVLTAMRIPGVTEERAWTMPLGLLFWYCDQWAELEGGRVHLEDDSEELEEDDGLPPETVIRVPQETFNGRHPG